MLTASKARQIAVDRHVRWIEEVRDPCVERFMTKCERDIKDTAARGVMTTIVYFSSEEMTDTFDPDGIMSALVSELGVNGYDAVWNRSGISSYTVAISWLSER